MLIHLTLINIAIVSRLEINFSQGLTVITGETGSGKSIIFEALALCQGGRSDPTLIKSGATLAEVTAEFICPDSTHPSQLWLAQHYLDAPHGKNSCIIKRTISIAGRSKVLINGKHSNLTKLREFAALLFEFHGQRAQQHVLNRVYQRQQLDRFSNNDALLLQMQTAFHGLIHTKKKRDLAKIDLVQLKANEELLNYQIEELDRLELHANLFHQLNAEVKRLVEWEELLLLCQKAYSLLQSNEPLNLLCMLRDLKRIVLALAAFDHEEWEPFSKAIEESVICFESMSHDLHNYAATIEQNPSTLIIAEKKLSNLLQIARKHGVLPESLWSYYGDLKKQRLAIEQQTNRYEQLKAETEAMSEIAYSIAKQLTAVRIKQADIFEKSLTQIIKTVGLPESELTILLEPADCLTEEGYDTLHFRLQTVPDKTPKPLEKSASSGELSRIALALQVVMAQTRNAPSLIFDEIDTGISGASAVLVAKLLQRMARSTQVIAITHLPQVAAAGTQHLHLKTRLSTDEDHEKNRLRLHPLTPEERIQAIACLLGGSEVTTAAQMNAEELLDSFSKKTELDSL